jgi:hypothetical protein
MTDERGRRYDTFVVRLWRDLVSRRLLRAEVEHVQSGHRSERRWRSAAGDDGGGDEWAWIVDQLRGNADEIAHRAGENDR